MTGWSPPSFSREWLFGIAALYVAFLAYTALIAQQILFGALVGVFLVTLYLAWRFLRAVEAIADAQQRLAHNREERSRRP